MDARVQPARRCSTSAAALNYYHNITIDAGRRPDHEHRRRHSRREPRRVHQRPLADQTVGGYGDPLLGFSASQPWDRSEKTWNVAATLTKLKNKHTVKFGGEWRKNNDMLLQTQDAGGPRGRFNFNASGTGSPRKRPR